jgi:hypothetical protein
MPTLVLGSNRVAATLDYRDDVIVVKFGFNEPIKNEIKVMDGARWNPGEKAWTVKNNQRNNFALDYLLGKNVFERYDKPLVDWTPKRKEFMGHQQLMGRHTLTRRQCYMAADPGCGKTFVSIEVTEDVGPKGCWYVCPRVALLSVKLEYSKWQSKYFPRFMTYEEMIKLMLNWTGGDAPQMVWFDEGHKLKTPTAKRTQAGQHLANGIRDKWGDDAYIVVMSGTPAPKSPLDYWAQIEVARPGFIREGTPDKFMDRIALRKRVEGDSGVAYPKLVTFYDDPRKCKLCGRLSDHPLHAPEAEFIVSGTDEKPHRFVGSVDEVSKMVKRLDGIMLRVNKNDCMDLPEFVYRKIELKPSKQTVAYAKMLAKTGGGAAQVLILHRELSDGFQYHTKVVGTTPCNHCHGKGPGEYVSADSPEYNEDSHQEWMKNPICIHCGGKGHFKEYQTETIETPTPKDQALLDILEEKDEDGRLITFGAFQGTIDKICRLTLKAGWDFICRDGRGWKTSLGNQYTDEDFIRMFQRDIPCPKEKINFIGHPKSVSMGLTLTASDTILWYSNSFDAEDRMQGKNRIHRPGSRGAIMIDLLHLPVDQLVLNNLERKEDMQSITLGDIENALNSEEGI